MDKIYESLGLEKLDEEKQKEIKQFLDETIELKAKEIALTKVDEQKEVLVEEYELKFEEYKSNITSKFSNFVDDILEQELSIPTKVMEYAHKGEMYEEVIELLKSKLAIDEGVLNDEIKDLMKDAKNEITNLKSKVNKLTSNEIELKEDCKKMAVDIYLRKKCDGLSEAKKIKIMSLLEGVEDISEIDRKFNILTDQIKVNEEEVKCKSCGAKVDVDDDEKTCPECGEDLSGKGDDDDDKDEKDESKKSKSKGKEELKEDFTKTNNIMESWVNVLKNNRL